MKNEKITEKNATPATPATPAKKTPGKRGRQTPMSQAEKDAKAASRETANKQRKAGLEALATNPQFTNPKFWNKVDSETLMAVKDAMKAAEKKAASAELAKVEEKAAELKAQLSVL